MIDQQLALNFRIIFSNLPFGFRNPKTTSVCLFVKDLDNEKHGADIDKSSREFREWLKCSKGVTTGIDQVSLVFLFIRQLYEIFHLFKDYCSSTAEA